VQENFSLSESNPAGHTVRLEGNTLYSQQSFFSFVVTLRHRAAASAELRMTEIAAKLPFARLPGTSSSGRTRSYTKR
jgi:hypothetical protein